MKLNTVFWAFKVFLWIVVGILACVLSTVTLSELYGELLVLRELLVLKLVELKSLVLMDVLLIGIIFVLVVYLGLMVLLIV